MTNILRDIERADLEREELRSSTKGTVDAVTAQMERARLEFHRAMKDMIVLDPKLDPDPYGSFGIALVDRLKAMGWRE
jgi:hypothetical protein